MRARTPLTACAGRPTLKAWAAGWGLSLVILTPALAQTGSVTNGKLIFESRCGACHSLKASRVGPPLGGVVGRVAGKAPDYSYSKALGAASHVWGRDKLLEWLGNPEAVVPGQVMGYSVETLQDRLDVVAYLESLSNVDATK